jgi:hypothetical protein
MIPDGKHLLVTSALIRNETLVVQVSCYGDDVTIARNGRRVR